MDSTARHTVAYVALADGNGPKGVCGLPDLFAGGPVVVGGSLKFPDETDGASVTLVGSTGGGRTPSTDPLADGSSPSFASTADGSKISSR